MLGVISTRIRVILITVIGAFLFVLALATWVHYAVHRYDQDEIDHHQEQLKPEMVKTQMKEERVRSIHYVPKAHNEDTDIAVVDHQKPLVVTVNGKRHEVPTKLVKENHKFDAGKLVLEEERQVNLDIKVPEPPRFKKGIYVESDMTGAKELKVGARVSYQTKPLDIDVKMDIWRQQGKHKQITVTATKWL